MLVCQSVGYKSSYCKRGVHKNQLTLYNLYKLWLILDVVSMQQ